MFGSRKHKWKKHNEKKSGTLGFKKANIIHMTPAWKKDTKRTKTNSKHFETQFQNRSTRGSEQFYACLLGELFKLHCKNLFYSQ